MKSPIPVTTDIEIVGFSAQERTLIASMFNLSAMRPRVYRKWDQTLKARPDCVLLDLDDDVGHLRGKCEIANPGGYSIVAFGTRPAQGLDVIAHIQRPIRWAGILNTLDTAFGAADIDAIAANGGIEVLSDAENELELQQVEPWYARGVPRIFQTIPAALILDPDQNEALSLKASLSKSGLRVDHVGSAAEATMMLLAYRYNCLILETKLPDLDGFALCRQLKQSQDRRRIATIILTTSRRPTDRIRGALAGCDAYLSKPVNTDRLMVALEKFIPVWSLS